MFKAHLSESLHGSQKDAGWSLSLNFFKAKGGVHLECVTTSIQAHQNCSDYNKSLEQFFLHFCKKRKG